MYKNSEKKLLKKESKEKKRDIDESKEKILRKKRNTLIMQVKQSGREYCCDLRKRNVENIVLKIEGGKST